MELIKIGKLLKTHGYKGHIRIFIEEFYMDDFKALDALFVDKLPYFITGKDINSESQAIISLEGIDTKEKAHVLQGKDIYAPEDRLAEIMEEDPYSDLVGYTIQDKTLGTIGTIEEIQEMPHQYLALVLKEGKEILIPMNDAFIVEIDDDQQLVEMQLPEGFLEIF